MKVNLSILGSVLSFLLLGSCGKSSITTHAFQMGEKVPVGSLIYTVLDTEWKAEIGEDASKMLPKERFLVVHLNITNSGGGDAGSPLTVLVDKQGKEHYEIQEVKGLPQWMPIFRRLSPASTEDGKVVFDVPVGLYKLRVADSGDAENEKIALVELPLELAAPQTMPTMPDPNAK